MRRVDALALHDMAEPSMRDASECVLLIGRMAADVARVEAGPHDALRQAHPLERCLEDVRLERPELIVGCWASR